MGNGGIGGAITVLELVASFLELFVLESSKTYNERHNSVENESNEGRGTCNKPEASSGIPSMP